MSSSSSVQTHRTSISESSHVSKLNFRVKDCSLSAPSVATPTPSSFAPEVQAEEEQQKAQVLFAYAPTSPFELGVEGECFLKNALFGLMRQQKTRSWLSWRKMMARAGSKLPTAREAGVSFRHLTWKSWVVRILRRKRRPSRARLLGRPVRTQRLLRLSDRFTYFQSAAFTRTRRKVQISWMS